MRAGAAKRGMDLGLGTVLAVTVIPLVVVLALGAGLSLRAWPFFVQTRVGRHGRHFRMVKIRTLPPSTPRAVSKYALRGVETSRFCRLLRLTHLDELPQLWLVPLGRMSLVGPRPEMPMLAVGFDQAFAAARNTVRPGCTGLWQVSNDAPKLINECPEYDLFYLRHGGMRLDLWILWHTVRSLVPGTSRITCAEVPASVRGRGLARRRRNRLRAGSADPSSSLRSPATNSQG